MSTNTYASREIQSFRVDYGTKREADLPNPGKSLQNRSEGLAIVPREWDRGLNG